MLKVFFVCLFKLEELIEVGVGVKWALPSNFINFVVISNLTLDYDHVAVNFY